MSQDYLKYENMIYKTAWAMARRYQQEVEDLIQEGWVIYLKAKETHDPEKSKFSTHLHHRLRALSDYCRKQKGEYSRTAASLDSIVEPAMLDVSQAMVDLYDQADHTLSPKALEALQFILSEQWRDKVSPAKFGMNTLRRYLALSAKETREVWEELTAFTAEAVPA